MRPLAIALLVLAAAGCGEPSPAGPKLTPGGWPIIETPANVTTPSTGDAGTADYLDEEFDVEDFDGEGRPKEIKKSRDEQVYRGTDGFYRFDEGGKRYRHFNGQWHECDENGCRSIIRSGAGVAAPTYFRRFLFR